MAEIQIEELQLRQALQNVNQRRNALLKEHKLEDNTPYRFNDEKLEIEKING